MTTQPELLSETRVKMQDAKFMPAQKKYKVLRQWESFLKTGLRKDKFTEDLYNHLIMHCSFIAHYNRQGFYSTYFEEGEDTVNFLTQFDNSNGIPESIEYGFCYWYTDPDYNDLNSEMCKIAGKYIPALITIAENKQRDIDIERARLLLAKHGLHPEV